MLRRLLPCFLVFLLLVPTLTWQSIWWDEGISLHLAGLPWRQIIADRATNIHPPLYFLVLSAWTRVVGRTPFAGRYLSGWRTVVPRLFSFLLLLVCLFFRALLFAFLHLIYDNNLYLTHFIFRFFWRFSLVFLPNFINIFIFFFIH